MQIEWQLLPIDAALAQYRGTWQDLCDSLGVNPSLAPGWVSLGCDALQVRSEVQVLLGLENSKLVAVLPVRLTSRRVWGISLQAVELGGGAVNYHAEIVSSVEPAVILRALAAVLQQRKRWHVLIAPNILLGTRTAAALQDPATLDASHVEIQLSERSPYLPLQGSWDEYLATRNKSFRYSVRRQEKDAAAAGTSEIRWFSEPQQVAEFWQALLDIEARSWKAEAGRAISSRPVELRYNEALLPYLADQGMLLGNVLFIDREPVAYNLCCNYRGWVGQLKTSFDNQHAKIRPGALIVQSMVQRVFDSQQREFDFLGDLQPHKLEWTDAIREHAEIRVYSSTWLARLMHRMKRAIERPAVVSE